MVFLIYSGSLCLQIGIFKSFTFKVIVDIVGLKSAVLVTVFYLLHLFFVSAPNSPFAAFSGFNAGLMNFICRF